MKDCKETRVDLGAFRSNASEFIRQQMLMDVLGHGINGVFIWLEDNAFELAVDAAFCDEGE